MPASSTAVQKQDFPHNRMSLPGPPQFLFLFELECPAVFIGDAEHLMGRPVSTPTNPHQPHVPIRIRTQILNGTARIFWSRVNIHPDVCSMVINFSSFKTSLDTVYTLLDPLH